MSPKPLILHGIFRAVGLTGVSEGLARSSAQQITESFPIPFLLVAFAVLFLRLEERNAWLLALLFCAFAAAPTLPNSAGIARSACAHLCLLFARCFRE